MDILTSFCNSYDVLELIAMQQDAVGAPPAETLSKLTGIIRDNNDFNFVDLKLVTLNALADEKYLGGTPDGLFLLNLAYLAQAKKPNSALNKEFSELENDYHTQKTAIEANPAKVTELNKEHLIGKLNKEGPEAKLSDRFNELGINGLSKAAKDEGNSAASLELALMYLNGTHGMPKQPMHGIHLLKQAASQGSAEAKTLLNATENKEAKRDYEKNVKVVSD